MRRRERRTRLSFAGANHRFRKFTRCPRRNSWKNSSSWVCGSEQELIWQWPASAGGALRWAAGGQESLHLNGPECLRGAATGSVSPSGRTLSRTKSFSSSYCKDDSQAKLYAVERAARGDSPAKDFEKSLFQL